MDALQAKRSTAEAGSCLIPLLASHPQYLGRDHAGSSCPKRLPGIPRRIWVPVTCRYFQLPEEKSTMPGGATLPRQRVPYAQQDVIRYRHAFPGYDSQRTRKGQWLASAYLCDSSSLCCPCSYVLRMILVLPVSMVAEPGSGLRRMSTSCVTSASPLLSH